MRLNKRKRIAEIVSLRAVSEEDTTIDGSGEVASLTKEQRDAIKTKLV